MQRVDAAVDHVIADLPVLEQFVGAYGAQAGRACIVWGYDIHKIRFFAMPRPRDERVLVLLQIEVRIK